MTIFNRKIGNLFKLLIYLKISLNSEKYVIAIVDVDYNRNVWKTFEIACHSLFPTIITAENYIIFWIWRAYKNYGSGIPTQRRKPTHIATTRDSR